MASHATKVEVYEGVSTDDVPSAAWGWSALSRRSMVIAGVCGGLFLLGMLFGNHQGNVENYFLIALAILVFFGTAMLAFQPKLTQRQTLTARNQPVGHVEPLWTAEQRNITGVYANLTREQRMALNMDGTSEG